MTIAVARQPFAPARLAIRRSLIRRQLNAVVAGKNDDLKIDLADPEIDPVALVAEVAAGLDPDGPPFARLAQAITRSGLADAVIDGLGSMNSDVRSRSVRIAGLLRMEHLVPSITPLLWSDDTVVRFSAARALGTIGGLRCAVGLLKAIQRVGHRPALIVALARAAPDLYLETILSTGQPRAIQPAVALAAGLRRRRLAIAALIVQLESGPSRMRAASSRALGWIGSPAGVPALTAALEHGDWRIRMSAAKALSAIERYQPGPRLRNCAADRNPRVRKAALDALRRHGEPFMLPVPSI